METVNTKSLPAGASVLMHNGRYFRIYIKVLTPEADIPTASMLQVQSWGYEVSKDNALLVDDNDEPIMLERQNISIPMANIHSGEDTMNGGWVARDLSYNPDKPTEEQKDIRQLKNLPKDGKPGDRVYLKDEKQTYVFSSGQYQNIRENRVSSFVAKTSPPAEVKGIDHILPQ